MPAWVDGINHFDFWGAVIIFVALCAWMMLTPGEKGDK